MILPTLAALPKVDVELGSLVTIGERNPVGRLNGMRDIAMYIQQVKPKLFYGNHTDNFTLGASLYYFKSLRQWLDIVGVPAAAYPQLPGFHDPYDYLRPGLATFEWKSKRWDEVPAAKMQASCPS